MTYTLPESPSSYTFDLEKSQRTNSSKNDLKIQTRNSIDSTISVFRQNIGQISKNFSYYAIFPQGMVGFGSSKVYFSVGGCSFQLVFINAHLVEPIGIGKLKGHSNYFIGELAINKINYFSYVVYENLYDGITLRYQITSKGLKYEFLVDPYADINQIRMTYLGVDEVKVAPTKVELFISEYIFVDDFLDVWYADNGQKISCSFTQRCYSFINRSTLFTIQFTLTSQYDYSRPIVIDPLLLPYSTYIGGSHDDIGNEIALDSSGNMYLTGWTKSSDFPMANASNSTYSGNRDVFVSKLSADGSTLLYSTFIGGNDFDTGNSIVVDSLDNIYITGATRSSDFPTINAYDSSHGGFSDVFLVKLSPNGSILFSTFIGGEGFDSGDSIVLDSSSNIYLAGHTNSIDFPVVNAYNSSCNGVSDAFIVKMATNGTSLLYSTYIGGSRDEALEFMVKHISIALDSANNLYITGSTYSNDFPTVNAYDSSFNGGWDVFVVILSANGSSLLFSTFIGGSLDELGNSLRLDSSNNIYITGTTNSEDFPIVNAYDSSYNGNWDIFVVKISLNGSLLYSTYIGGNLDEYGNSIALSNNIYSNNIYITGETSSEDFPMKNSYDSTINGESDVFFIKMSSDGYLQYSTFIGGNEFDVGTSIVLDGNYNIFIAGTTKSSNFPIVHAYNPMFMHFADVFVVKMVVEDVFVDTRSTTTDTTFVIEPNVIFGIILLFGMAIILLSVRLYHKR